MLWLVKEKHTSTKPVLSAFLKSIINLKRMGNGNYAAERELCFKLELCAVMALVWDVRGYLLGCLVWDSYQVLAECQISLLVALKLAAPSALNI